jgi:hypothetical protein
VNAIVVLIELPLHDHDVQRLAHFFDPDPVTIHVVAATSKEGGSVARAVDETMTAGSFEEPEHPESALEASISALRAAGVESVDGELAGADTVAATLDAATTLSADQIWVVTPLHWLEDTLHRDWAHHLRSRATVPVLRVISGTDQVIS